MNWKTLAVQVLDETTPAVSAIDRSSITPMQKIKNPQPQDINVGVKDNKTRKSRKAGGK